MIHKFVNEDGRNWYRWLDPLLFVVREVPQASTGFSPSVLLFGRTLQRALDLVKESCPERLAGTWGAKVLQFCLAPLWWPSHTIPSSRCYSSVMLRCFPPCQDAQTSYITILRRAWAWWYVHDLIGYPNTREQWFRGIGAHAGDGGYRRVHECLVYLGQRGPDWFGMARFLQYWVWLLATGSFHCLQGQRTRWPSPPCIVCTNS